MNVFVFHCYLFLLFYGFQVLEYVLSKLFNHLKCHTQESSSPRKCGSGHTMQRTRRFSFSKRISWCRFVFVCAYIFSLYGHAVHVVFITTATTTAAASSSLMPWHIVIKSMAFLKLQRRWMTHLIFVLISIVAQQKTDDFLMSLFSMNFHKLALIGRVHYYAHACKQ